MKRKEERRFESEARRNGKPTIGDLVVSEESDVEAENISEELERKLRYNVTRERRSEYDAMQVEADNPELFEDGIVARKKPLGEIREDEHGKLDIRSHAEEKLGHPVGERPRRPDGDEDTERPGPYERRDETIPSLVRWEDGEFSTVAWKRGENEEKGKTVIEPARGFPKPEGMKEVVVPSDKVEHYGGCRGE